MPFPSFSVQCKVFLGVVVSLLAGGPAPPAGAASSQRAAIGFQTPQVASLEALRTASATPVRVRFDEGFPVTLSFDVEATGATGVERATNFLSQYAPLFRQDHPDVQLLPLRDSGDPAGMELVRFYQTFQGLPVFGAELAVHVLNSATGGPAHIFFASGALLSPVDAYRVTITLDTVPAITADAAADVARTELSRPGAPVLGESPLMIYDPTLFGMAPGPRLVWRVTLGGGDPVQILVDASSSQAVFQRPLTATGTGLADFDLDLEDANGGNMGDTNCFNPTTIDDQIGDEDGYDSTYSTDLDAVMEWGAARTTYLTYHNRYGRHSFDDDDGELYVYVH
ncbi:MAG: hypothetical protein ACE5HU_08130, partial [Acidobacteriota bacterium]